MPFSVLLIPGTTNVEQQKSVKLVQIVEEFERDHSFRPCSSWINSVYHWIRKHYLVWKKELAHSQKEVAIIQSFFTPEKGLQPKNSGKKMLQCVGFIQLWNLSNVQDCNTTQNKAYFIKSIYSLAAKRLKEKA